MMLPFRPFAYYVSLAFIIKINNVDPPRRWTTLALLVPPPSSLLRGAGGRFTYQSGRRYEKGKVNQIRKGSIGMWRISGGVVSGAPCVMRVMDIWPTSFPQQNVLDQT